MLLPKKIRKLIALLRGQASPMLVGLAVGMGFWFGLVPGFSGVSAVILVALVLINAPIGMFLLFAGLGKSFCFATAPILYHLGVFAQGSAGWFFQLLSKIPIMGLTDFNRPAVAGSFIAGPIIGVILGFIAGNLILGFRKTWLKLESNSEKFTKWQSKGFVKVLDRIVIGKRAKGAKEALEAKTVYIRKAGAALVVLVLIVCVAGAMFVKDSLVRNKASQALTKTNGATVDIEKVNLSPASGKVSITGIGMTNRDNPSENKIQIGQVAAKASVYDLSVGRLVMDEVLISDVKFDQKRDAPGEVLSEQQARTGDAEPRDTGIDNVDLNKLDKYFENAKQIREFLNKVSRWIPKSEDEQKASEPIKPQKYLDYLTAGPAQAPTVKMLAKKIIADKVELGIEQFGLSKITVSNISNAPAVAGLPVEIDIASQSGGAHAKLICHFEDDDSPGKISGTFEGIDLAMMQASMNKNNAMLFEGGKASGTIAGRLTRDSMDLSLTVNIKDMQANSGGKSMLGLDEKTLSEVLKVMKDLDLTMRIVGPVAAPQIVFDSDSLTNTFAAKLKEAGKARLASEIDNQIKNVVGEKMPDGLKEIIKPANITDGLKSLFAPKKKD